MGSCSNAPQDPWTILESLPLDPAIEAQIDEILPKLTPRTKGWSNYSSRQFIGYSRRCKNIG